MTVREAIRREAQDMGRRCKLVKSLRFSSDDVLVVLYDPEPARLPSGSEGVMHQRRLAVYVGESAKTSIIVDTRFER